MKKLLLLTSALALMLSSCISFGNDDPPVSPYDPVIMTRPEFEAAVQAMPVRDIENAGKIYIKDQFMFVNDKKKGFHVYNYADPANPVKIGFINVPGATDLAVRNNIIYINQAVDLVTLTYHAETNTITLHDRDRNVFPPMLSPFGDFENVPDDEVVIGWTLTL